MATHLSFDLGGTKLLRYCISSAGKSIDRFETGPNFSKEAFEQILRDSLKELPEKPAKIGVAIAGLIRNDTVIQSDAMPKINGMNAKSLGELGAPLVFINDADAALTAQAAERPEEKNIIMVMVGTGIGMSYMMNGAICTGTTGMAGEFGKIPIWTPHGVKDLEDVAGGAAIIKKLGMSPHEIVTEINSGNSEIMLEMEKSAEYLGVGLSMLINLMNPEAIYLGGGTFNYPGYRNLCEDVARSNSLEKLQKACRFESAREDATVVAEGAMIAAGTPRSVL